MTSTERPAQIVVLAGTNGAGKSSVAGVALRRAGAEYFNPDEITRRILALRPELSLQEANSRAWMEGRDRLLQAIDERLSYAFETTLGGSTITAALLRASDLGIGVRVWYVGLDSVELHLARVRARVAAGGHDIPEERIRARYDDSRRNLIRLIPRLAELMLWDNSTERDPAAGERPEPLLVLHSRSGEVVRACPPAGAPGWAKPIVQAALLAPPRT